MTQLLTAPSTPRLSEVARHVVMPAGIVTTAWPRIVGQCREMGVEFDSWQHGVGSIALGKREDGRYAATIGGVVLSIPRQVGKTFLVGMIVVAMCILFPGFTALWTSHHGRTSTKTFRSLQGMVKKKKIWPHVLLIRQANGEQEIVFRNGSIIMVGARAQGFGRGFDEVDVEVFDEAQILDSKSLEDMVAATNQSKHEAGALLFFMGTPPRPGDNGEEFENRRREAVTGESDDMVYVEFSADPDADPDDWDQVAKANPSFPHRTPREAVLRMRKNLTDELSFKREALGIWDPVAGNAVIDPVTWASLADPNARDNGTIAYAIDVSPDRSMASIGMAGLMDDGRTVIDFVEGRKSVDWVVAVAKRINEKNSPRCFVVDKYSPAATLIQPLIEAGVPVVEALGNDHGRACGQFYDLAMAAEPMLVHLDQPTLNVALSKAAQRNIGAEGLWGWNRKTPDADITPLVAVTLAIHGLTADTKVKKPSAMFAF